MIKLITTMACISLGFASISMAQDVVITQNPDCATDAATMVACGGDGSTAENWFARNILIDQDVVINSITWGSANQNTTGGTIHFSTASGPGNPDGVTLTPVGQATAVMDAGPFYDTPVDVPFDVAAGTYLVVEFQFHDSGLEPGNWPANTTTATETTYIKADACGLAAYTDVAGIGFPDSQMIMCLNATLGQFDPCDVPLPTVCAADVDGDGAVAVSDVLAIIGSWGICGDGTFRPTGDIAPMPNGDCCVTVADVLAVVGSWGADCAIYGSCCMADASCSQMTSADCLAGGGAWTEAGDCATSDCAAGACCLSTTDCADYTADFCSANGGSYKGDGTACATTDCAAVTPGDTCDIAINVADGANAFDTTNNSLSPDLAECAADSAAFGWTEPVIDIWFSWTAGATDDYVVDTCDVASFDTSLLVYDACGGTVLECNGDVEGPCQTYSSSLVLSATAGTTYIIRIGGWSAVDFGTGTLNINVLPPPLPGACCFPDESCLDNLDSVTCASFGGSFAGEDTTCADAVCDAGAGNECADAIPAYEGPNAFDTSLMTDSGYGEPDESMCAGTYLNWLSSPDAWMVYTPASNGTLSVSLCDATSYDTSLVLYEGNDCASLTQVACNGDETVETGCQAYYSGVYDLPVYADQSIYIRIGGYNAAVGSGTATVTFVGGEVVGACCMADGSCMDLVSADCGAAGGAWDSSQMCDTASCPAPFAGCAAGSDVECDACAQDGDDSALDCNAGLNGPTGTEFQAIALGMPVCGTGSVFVDGPTGDTYRDLDWFTNATLNAGGDFTISAGTSGMDLLFGVVDNAAGAFVAAYMIPGGFEGSADFLALPAGDYSILVGPNEWNTDWTCASGLVDYSVQLD